MNKRSGVMVAGLCLVLAAGGCARNQDPSQAGFFSGVANLADGTYDQRVADREATRDRTVAQALPPVPPSWTRNAASWRWKKPTRFSGCRT